MARTGRRPRRAGAGGRDVCRRTAHPVVEAGRRPHNRRGDSIFRGLSTAAAVSIIVFIMLIALFLLIQAVPSLRADHVNFLTSAEFDTNDANNLRFGIRDLLVVTLMSSVVALLLAVPVAVFIALFITMYAPRGLSRVFGSIIDLLAAVPSIVFGLWGIFVLAPKLEPFTRFLNDKLGWFPLFGDGNVSLSGGGNIFTAALVLGHHDSSDHYGHLPGGIPADAAPHRGRPALGATRWEVIRTAVLPYGRSGHNRRVDARAGPGARRDRRRTDHPAHLGGGPGPLFDGGYTFASKIASAAAEFSEPLPTGAYIAAGFVLFVLTFLVNAAARAIAGGKVNG